MSMPGVNLEAKLRIQLEKKKKKPKTLNPSGCCQSSTVEPFRVSMSAPIRLGEPAPPTLPSTGRAEVTVSGIM